MERGLGWIDRHTQALCDASDAIWEYAEVGLQEHRSAALVAGFLAREGFSVVTGVAGMPTALVASFGRGGPVIGFLGEYDALPGLSQTVTPRQEPLVPGGAGHGCGHNLLGVGALAAAIALKHQLESDGREGTVRFYGCPAEETLVGKVFMARDGLFDDLDAALTWHPMTFNTIWSASSLAMNSVKFVFHGRASHAAASPDLGVSALDAVELMNIGVNFLREHIVQDARIHYVITKGGGEPNIVPAKAESWYYVRAPERAQVAAIYDRIVSIAQGAAMMTGAQLEINFQVGCYNYLSNPVLAGLLEDNMRKVGGPAFTPEDHAFARAIEDSFPPGQKLAALRGFNASPELAAVVAAMTVHEGIASPFDTGRVMPGSTDVGDVSWLTPTGQLTAACWPVGTASHSWQATAASGAPMGHKGMILAAKAMAMTGYDLVTNPELLPRAKAALTRATGGKRPPSPIPPDLAPPLDQLSEHGHSR
jgi:aminobenzoyl-glutamate utilization protein B